MLLEAREIVKSESVYSFIISGAEITGSVFSIVIVKLVVDDSKFPSEK